MAEIVVSENIQGAAMDRLRRDFQVAFDPELWKKPDRLADAVRSAKALIVRNQTQVTSELIAQGELLQIIGRAGAGLDNIDVAAARQANIPVSFTPNENSRSVAELTLGLMLGLGRRLPAADRDTRQGGWDRQGFTGIELQGRTLGIVGLGRIGRLVAGLARPFGMRILAHDDYVPSEAPILKELEIQQLPLAALLEAADFVSVHIPLTEETRGMFDYDLLCHLKPTAYFLNVSRGEVVDESGLIRALDERQLAGAALDVRNREPPGVGRLEEMPNVILTPHIGAFTQEAQERVVETVCSDVRAVLEGRLPGSVA